MIIDGFLGDRLYSVILDEDEYALFSELEEQREFASIRATKKAAKKIVNAINSGKATGKHGVDAIKLDTDIAKQGYKTMNGVTKHKLGKVTFAHPTFNGNSVKKLQSIQKKAEKAITGNIERPMFSKGAQNQFDKAIQANDSAWKRYHQKRRNYI